MIDIYVCIFILFHTNIIISLSDDPFIKEWDDSFIHNDFNEDLKKPRSDGDFENP